MDLSNRKQAVLSAIIRTYIETGEPVGSKILTELLDNAPSSATLRNEMSELCALGLLTQPHTSAGRIPTGEALKLYVSRLMHPITLDFPTKEYINSMLPSEKDIERFPPLAAKALGELTGLPSFSYYLVDDTVFLKRAELIQINPHSALLFLITSDGRARNRICRLSGDFSSLKAQFDGIVSAKVLNIPLKQMNKTMLQNVIASAGLDALSIMPLITALFEMANEAARSQVSINNATALYRFCGEEKALKIISLIQNGDSFINEINGIAASNSIIFGDETALNELKGTTLVLHDYSVNGTFCGKIGIIGPQRMSYEQIIPSINYTAERLSDMMSEAVDNTED